MEHESESAALSRSDWWSERRFRYNVGIVAAGALAFVCYAAVCWTVLARIDPAVEITCFTIAFQAFGYLIAIGIANICYFLGPVSEAVIRPRDPHRFRRIAYGLGFWFSVLLPFSIPVLLLYLAVFHPDHFRHEEFAP